MFIGFINGVGAKSAKLKCDYTVDFSSIGGKSVDFSAIYYDDGSTSLSSFSNVGGTDTLGNYYIINERGSEKDFKKYVSEKNMCPEFNFSDPGIGANQLEMNVADSKGTSSNGYIVAKKKGSSSETGNKASEKKVVCQQHAKAMRNESTWDVYFNFYEINGKRYWSAGSSTNDANVASEVEVGSYILPTVDGYQYHLSDDMISDVYETGKCKKEGNNYKFWLECSETGGSQDITLKLSKPDDSRNCSYGVKRAKKDNGLDVNDNPASPSYNSHFTATDGKVVEFLKKIYNLLKILVPLGVIVFSIVDFLKVLFLSDDKNYKEAYSKLIKRVFIGIVIFLVPVLVSFIINLTGMNGSGILTIFE